MTIRIQPRDIEVPADDPFEHDLLGRKESIEALTNVISSLDGPCVMAVDAGWGMGKTTFLKMWAQHLRNERFPVVEFNAWETDFAQDPFIALYSEITGGLSELPGASGRIDGLRAAAGAVFRALPAAAARVALSAVPQVGPQLVSEVSSRPPTPREAVAESYQEAKTALRAFRDQLVEIAAAIARENDNLPLVVMIDELDRCRPTYAIELLEAAKHFFNVDHIVFVVCLDRAQLAHSVKAVYGACFDAEGYLWRFFDIDYRLPSPDRKRFVDALLATVGIAELLQSRRAPISPRYGVNILQEFFNSPQFTLRRVQHAIRRLAVVLSSVPTSQFTNMDTLVVLLLVRTVLPDLYRRIVIGEATDEEAVNTLFNRPGFGNVRGVHVGSLARTVLIACVLLSSQRQDGTIDMTKLPLLQRYRDVMQSEESEDQSNPDERRDAQVATQFIDRRWPLDTLQDSDEVQVGWSDVGFEDAVRRIELFSDDLTGKELG